MNGKYIVPAAAMIAFILASQPAETQASPNLTRTDSVAMKLPSGQKQISCAKLGPNGELSLDFLLAMHTEDDGYTERTRKENNLNLHAAADLIQHLTVHGVDKEEIKRVMRACGVSNVEYSSAPGMKR